jgi:deoxycytidylate deaminase
MTKIKLPYIPDQRSVNYVDISNNYMKMAKNLALSLNTNLQKPSAAVIVKDQNVIGKGSICENYHQENGCKRVELDMPTGEGYELCPGCNPDNHSEANAIKDAKSNSNNIKDANLYLWGHWWFCKDCWDKMIKEGIKNTYLVNEAWLKFR